MELTKQERRLAEAAAKSYHRFFYRRSELIGWLGVPIFCLGVLPFFSWPRWLDVSFLTVGCIMVVCSGLGITMSALGKIYQRLQDVELHSSDDETDGQ